ncbi:scyllo-inositol 2-dehydrogenase (NAD(+)) [Cohnella xylanilytica]|uniref:Gfo/Idh/MocA family oxidoreductase n=1 Tax=Cohnella xylanilytica TaxID=557555 RepID=A0A841U758_9BACL|nr:Gfo/Idh/MocA family oxidoreductase [Cohnella xylanilytica]MBB6693851.1 Gfo/Idh/MocA family oxidoreductase [Cohnella xylanilytica]GIO14102.1 scyllo-inositol 2-dehydrogenase (NAD(+)) [Cohnella xylanilytica]
MAPDIVNVCVIGAGRAGMIHAANFRKSVPYARLAAFADPNREAAEQAARSLEVDKVYTDYRDALADESIHAVVVVTPTVYHREIVVAAAAAGKHVLCEKPMAMNEAECKEMIEACERGGVKLQLAFMRRFDESFRDAKRQIEAGAIGDVVMVKSLTRGPSTPMPWMYDIRKSNGPLAEVNSHDIDTLRWFAGSEIAEVHAAGGNFRCPDIREEFPDFYDTVAMTARFADGKLGSIDGAMGVQYGYDSRVEILGTEGVIYLGQTHERTIVTARRDKTLQRPFMNSWRSLFKEAYLAEDSDFIACIREDRTPAVTGYDGMMAVRIVEAGNASLARGELVRLAD